MSVAYYKMSLLKGWEAGLKYGNTPLIVHTASSDGAWVKREDYDRLLESYNKLLLNQLASIVLTNETVESIIDEAVRRIVGNKDKMED